MRWLKSVLCFMFTDAIFFINIFLSLGRLCSTIVALPGYLLSYFSLFFNIHFISLNIFYSYNTYTVTVQT